MMFHLDLMADDA